MTGWGTTQDRLNATPTERPTPTPATLAEVATAAQRWQLTTLLEALKAHPDLAAQLYLTLRGYAP